MALKLITPATTFPVTLEEVKAHCRVSFDDDDDLLQIYLEAATSHCEEFQGRAYCEQTWELTLDEFPLEEIEIRRPPLIGVVSIKYDDGDGLEQTVDVSEYTVDTVSEPGWVLPADSWPSGVFDGINAVRIRFKAGYADSMDSPNVSLIPKDIKAAILLYVGTLYANRETIVIGQSAVTIPWAAEQLLRRRMIHVQMA
jgi:uncharacterized phiE125 gp8 family phage protein